MLASTLQIFKSLISKRKNTLFSPYCLEILYTMVAEGTKGDVRKELLEHLEFQPDQNVFENLSQKIDSLKEVEPTSQIEQKNTIYHIGLIHPMEEYCKKIQSKLSLDLKPVPDEYKNVAFILESVLNIKAKWKQPFEQIHNVHEPFYLTDKKAIETYFIEQDKISGGSKTKYLKKDSFHAIQIPMQDERLCVEIYLPYKKDGLNDFIKNLSKEKLLNWNNQFQDQDRMHVVLPKFEIEAKYETLQEDMKAIGIKNLFLPSWDFLPMLESFDPLIITRATQENKFRLDEIGIEAGSVTRFYGGVTGITTYDKFVLFEANHAFMYLVRDSKTNIVLFIGIFEEPDQSIDFTLYHSNLKEIEKYNSTVAQLSFRAEYEFAAFTISKILEQASYQNDFLDWYVNLLKKFVRIPLGKEFDKIRYILENISWLDHDSPHFPKVVPDILKESKKEILKSALAQLQPIIYSISDSFRFNDYFIQGEALESERVRLLQRCSYALIDLNIQLPDFESLAHLNRLENDPWGEPIHEINFIFKPLPDHCELDEATKRKREEFRKIRRLKPFLFDLTIRGSIYLHMMVLNQLMDADKDSNALINKLINHIIGFLLGRNVINHLIQLNLRMTKQDLLIRILISLPMKNLRYFKNNILISQI